MAKDYKNIFEKDYNANGKNENFLLCLNDNLTIRGSMTIKSAGRKSAIFRVRVRAIIVLVRYHTIAATAAAVVASAMLSPEKEIIV